MKIIQLNEFGLRPPLQKSADRFYRGLVQSEIKAFHRSGKFSPSDVPVFCDWEVMEYEGVSAEDFEDEGCQWERQNPGKWINVTADPMNAKGYGETLIWVAADIVDQTPSGQYGVVPASKLTRKTQGSYWDWFQVV
jgi:hypothetical protein